MQLYIGNKNYSSWSLRAWLLMTHAGIPFEEQQLRLDWDDGSPFKTTLLALAPTGRVPLLIDDGFAVWDSLAIAETLAERFPDKHLWPRDPKQRARARSLCAEMHSGFGALRNRCPMNVEASLPEVGARCCAEWPRRRRRPAAASTRCGTRRSRERRSVPVRRLQHRRRLLRAGLLARAHLRACRCRRGAPAYAERILALPGDARVGARRRWPSTTSSPRTSPTASAPDAAGRRSAKKKRTEVRSSSAAGRPASALSAACGDAT